MSVRRYFDPSDTLDQLAGIRATVESMLATIPEDQFNASPVQGSWSPCQCIEHLLLSGEAFHREWKRVLDVAREKPPATAPRVRYGFVLRAFLRLVEPPYRFKAKTTASFHPTRCRTRAEALQGYLVMLATTRQLIHQCRALNAAAMKIRSPFAQSISYSMGFSFDIEAAHERRHLWQAQQAVRK